MDRGVGVRRINVIFSGDPLPPLFDGTQVSRSQMELVMVTKENVQSAVEALSRVVNPKTGLAFGKKYAVNSLVGMKRDGRLEEAVNAALRKVDPEKDLFDGLE